MKSRNSFFRKFIPMLFTGIIAATTSQAQQEPMYSQYMFNTMAINPSYAGSRDVLSFTTVGRYQWLGVEGSPKTWSFTLDMPVKNEKMGIGLAAYSDGLGLQENVGLSVAYSYKVKVGEKTTLSLGVSPGIHKMGWRLSDVQNLTDEDNVFDAMNNINRLFPNVGAGFFLSNDKSYIGFSVPQIVQQKLNVFDSEDRIGVSKTYRHYYTMMGFVLGKGNIKVKPSTMIRYTPGTGVGIDGNINLWIKDKIAFGVSGRKSQMAMAGVDFMDAAVGMFEIQLTPQLRFGYAFDYNLNRLNTTTKTGASNKLTGTPTHEGLLRYEFGFGKNKIITPRYF